MFGANGERSVKEMRARDVIRLVSKSGKREKQSCRGLKRPAASCHCQEEGSKHSNVRPDYRNVDEI